MKHVPFEDRTVELVKEVKTPQGKSKKLPFKTNQQLWEIKTLC